MWTEGRTETLKKLWADGRSAKRIGRCLGGVTEGAVTAKVHRLGLPGRKANSWTEERLEWLKELWAEGQSASRIAGRLGGITPNAVIGKVHRLGLPGRRTVTRKQVRRMGALRQPKSLRKKVSRGVKATTAAAAPRLPIQYELPFLHMPTVTSTLAPMISNSSAPTIPASFRLRLLDLKKCMCRWPIGDPRSDEFHFCGRPKADGSSYCEHHSRIAFQPTARRRR